MNNYGHIPVLFSDVLGYLDSGYLSGALQIPE